MEPLVAAKGAPEGEQTIAAAPADVVMDDPVTRVAENEALPSLLGSYYKQYYPFELMFKWLSYGDPAYMRNREWSYTKNPDIYIRYRIQTSPEEFRADVVKVLPDKIDIGGHYNKPPAVGNKETTFVTEKELVFDIDMDDYNSVKGCGCIEKAQICKRCWNFMSIAVEVVDRVLRDDFGFKCIMWFFSGRRGMHCWVSDPEARRLQNEARHAITEYMGLLESKIGRPKLRLPLHPSLQHIYDEILLPRFLELILPQHALFESEENWTKVLDLIPGEDIKKTMQEHYKGKGKYHSGRQKWDSLVATINEQQKKLKHKLPIIEEIVCNYTWPRLDANVTKDNKHLLKAPFVIHPSTQRVCVPVNAEKIYEFDFEKVPRVSGVIETHGEFAAGADRTPALAAYIEYFKEFVASAVDIANKDAKAIAARIKKEAAANAPNKLDF